MADKTTERDPREAFVRLAEARTNACLDKVRLLGNLAAGQYEKSPEDVEAIFGAIRGMLDATEAKFYATKAARPEFKL